MARMATAHLSQCVSHDTLDSSRPGPASPTLGPANAQHSHQSCPCPLGVPQPPYLPIAAVRTQGEQTGLHTLVPGQHILLVTLQELVQDPE